MRILNCKINSTHGGTFSKSAEKILYLGKPHHKNIAVHLGIAQIAIGPPSPHSNGHSVAPIFGQNHVNARLYMVISPKNRCHKPSWQGFRPPAPNGQCPNELLYFYGGASLRSLQDDYDAFLVLIFLEENGWC